MDETTKMILMFLPLILLQFGLEIAALVNLFKRERVVFNNKIIWVLIILLGQSIGSLAYFIVHSFAKKGED